MYLAVDLGTTGCRGIIFDSELNQLGAAYEEYGLITPKEKYVEQDAELWWELTCRTAQNAIKKAGVSGFDIKGISISSQGITVVPVDCNIRPLRNALSWLDVRAEREVQTIVGDFGEKFLYDTTGRRMAADYTIPKLLWIRENEPEIYERAYKFLMPLDFLIAKLTGRCVTDHSMASGTLMYDLRARTWSSEILKRYEIDSSKLPEILYSGECAGKILPEVAASLGLSEDCVVGIGAQDQKCAAHGVGLCDGAMTISLGTAAAVTKLWHEPKTEINKESVSWCSYVSSGSFVTEGVIDTAGTCLRWVRDMMFKTDDYSVIDSEAIEARERGCSVVFMPYMTGVKKDGNALEMAGCFFGINMATSRGDIALAVMEGVAFRIRTVLEAMEAYGNVKKIILLGGGAKSKLWSQIIADAIGMTLEVPSVIEAAGAGAARLAAQAAGEDIGALKTAYVYEPTSLAAEYDEKYKKFKLIKDKLWAEEA